MVPEITISLLIFLLHGTDGAKSLSSFSHKMHGLGFASTKTPLLVQVVPVISKCALMCMNLLPCSGFTMYELYDGNVRCEFVEGENNATDISAATGATFYEITRGIQPIPHDCADLLSNGETASGVYDVNINVTSETPIMKQVYCDMTSSGGGWTVVLRREDGSEDFERHWAPYREGFGDRAGEFWAGNELLHRVTSTLGRQYAVRVELQSFTGETRYADYSAFSVDSESLKYRLHISGYSGNATDSFTQHDNFAFTTPDQDNDDASYNCGERFHSGWWYHDCSDARLTGLYGDVVPDDVESTWLGSKTYYQGILWNSWLGNDEHPKRVEMKIRPL